MDAGAFVRGGFAALRGAVDPETAAACRELIWGSLEGARAALAPGEG